MKKSVSIFYTDLLSFNQYNVLDTSTLHLGDSKYNSNYLQRRCRKYSIIILNKNFYITLCVENSSTGFSTYKDINSFLYTCVHDWYNIYLSATGYRRVPPLLIN